MREPANPADLEWLEGLHRAIRVSPKMANPPAPPRLLYHYTSAEGFLGIIGSGRLWGSSYRTLNDTSELAYGMQLISRVCDELAREPRSNRQRSILTGAVQLIAGLVVDADVFLACFSEEGDLLSQWVTYGPRPSNSFALGFEASELHYQGGGNPYSFTRVIYDEKSQREAIGEVIRSVLYLVQKTEKAGVFSGLEDADHVLERADSLFKGALAAQFVPCAAWMKHPGFAAEKEWRLAHVSSYALEEMGASPPAELVTPITFLPGPAGLRSYADLMVRARLPLKTVTIGPAAPDSQLVAARTFLRRQGYGSVEVLRSGLPYRG